jgi:hypothetical protein
MSRKLFGVCLFCIPIIFLLLATSVFALDWQLVDDGDPSPRGEYGIAYDTLRSNVILFGGEVGLLGNATDTWEYDGSKWEKKMTSSQPTVTSGSGSIQGMVYDSERNRVVLLVYKYPDLETWEYDGTDWTQIITQDSPPLGLNSMAYDRWRKKTVLYHGRPNSTWEYDGTNWSEVQTTNNPGDRSGYKMVFDSARNRVLLFGGWLFSGNFASDLWAYDGNDWTPVATQNTPSPRGNFGLAYNATDDKLILYGGYQSCGASVCYLRDTWEFNGTDWSQVTTSNAPSSKHVSEIIYDAQKNRTVLFGGLRYENWGGGCDTQIYFDDTWEFDGTDWIEINTKSSPTARMYPGVTYDPERNVTLMFGGKNIDLGCPLNDTWVYDGTWQEIQLNNPPPPMVDRVLTYDTNRKRAIMVGMGQYEPGSHCCDPDFIEGTTTWEFDGTEWLMVNTPTPAPNRNGTPISFDSVRNKVVAMTITYPGNNIEVWEYDGTDWTQAVTPHLPTPRRFFSFAFDKVRGKTVLFGGEDPSTNPYTYLHDTWEYDGTDWTKVETAYSPETSVQTLMTFDSSREMIILYGGYGSGQVFHDTWAYNGSNWQKIEAGASPLTYCATQIVFDENRKRTVLFGGIDPLSIISGETWELYEKPAVQWAKTYGGSSQDWASSADSIQQTSDGGYIVVGDTYSFGAGNGDFWVLKLDTNGNMQWQKTYGGSGNDYASSIQQTSDGGYIVAGVTPSFGAGDYDIWVLKLDTNGNVQWQNTYGGSNDDEAYSIQQTLDNGYIVGGYTYSFGAGFSDVWVLKLDANGNVLWQKTYGGSSNDWAESIQQILDGSYVVAGVTDSFDAGNGDFWVLKLDANGNVLWQKTYGGSAFDRGRTIQQTSDGGYIVGGMTQSFGAGNGDAWELKLDANGNVQWQKTYGGNDFEGAAIWQTPDGTYIATGRTYSFGAGGDDLWVFKLDTNGNMVWQKTYGGSGNEFARSIQQTSDGGYIVGSFTNSFGTGSEDVWVLKLDANGEIPGCSAMGTSNAIVNNTSATITNTTVTGTDTTVSPQTSTASITDTNATVTEVCYYAPPPLTIGYSPTSFTFTATQGGSNPPSQSLSIWNAEGGTLNWSVSDNATWLSLSPTSGTNSGTVTVSVNIAGLTAGTYNATITITAPGATNSPVYIPVTLIVTPPPPITILSPNGGEAIPSGSIYTIRWNASSGAVKFTLRYSLNNGSTWKLIASNRTGTSYDWNVPILSNNKKNCLVKVIGFNSSGTKVGEDISDSTFTIEVVKVISPDGGETLTSGTIHTITWQTNGTIRPVANAKLFRTINGGATWTLIKTLTGNPGSYNWTVPNVSSSSCKVKVVLKDAGGVTVGSDVSDGYFTIQPQQ